MSKAVDRLVPLVWEAQGALRRMIQELGTPVQEWRNGILPPYASSGFAELDRALNGGLLPAGLTVELVGDDPGALQVAVRWAACAQGQERFAAVLDPFDELRSLPAVPLDARRTLVVDMGDPHHLASAAIPLIERRAIDALVIPPGVLREGYLYDRPRRRLRHTGDEQRAFQRALEGICWLGRRRGTVILLVRGNGTGRSLDVLGLSHVRLRVSGQGRGLVVRVEHNSLRPSSCGKSIRLLEGDRQQNAPTIS